MSPAIISGNQIPAPSFSFISMQNSIKPRSLPICSAIRKLAIANAAVDFRAARQSPVAFSSIPSHLVLRNGYNRKRPCRYLLIYCLKPCGVVPTPVRADGFRTTGLDRPLISGTHEAPFGFRLNVGTIL